MSTAIATIPESAVGDALPASAIRAQVDLIQQVMKEVMIKDTHYGTIPGTPKPSLYKPGAEKLCLTFRLDPQYTSTERFIGEHLFVNSTCVLFHQTTGRRLGSGQGSCSTKESKYAYRKGQRLCPKCGKEAIIKGKDQYGGGWLCWQKKDGCGAKFVDGAKEIEDQNTDRIPNEDLADQYNTVLKMANKRSLIAAVLNVTAASDIFTQDVEDMPSPPNTQQAATQEAHATTKTFAEKFPEQAQKIAEKLGEPEPSVIVDPPVSQVMKEMEPFQKMAQNHGKGIIIKPFNEILLVIDGNADWNALKQDWKNERKLKNLSTLTPSAQKQFLEYMREKVGKEFPY